MKTNDDKSEANVVQNFEDEDLYLATTNEVAKSKWIMDSPASKHICRDRAMFDTLKTNGEFGHFNLGNGEKMKVEVIETVRMKLHNNIIQTFQNVRFVPSATTNVISLGEMTSPGYRYVGLNWGCKDSPYSQEDKPLSSYLSYIIPSVSFDGSKTNKNQHELKPIQSTSAGYNYENFEYQDVPSDNYVDCTNMDLLKDDNDNINEDPISRRTSSSSSSEVFEEANEQQTPNTSKKSRLNLTDDSTFISPELYEFLEICLPNIVKGRQWVLLYSTLKHGVSLRTLIRKSAELSCPGLLIAGDMQGAVFGGLLDCPLKPTAKRKYQGTNQTFVFTTIYGQPRLFLPTGVNRYYYMCLNGLLALGGGGNYALCLEEDLLTGTSGPSDTFGNKCLAHSPEFELKNVELWGFAHPSPFQG
ncbi:Oxidation resistance protein 1 [Glycine max]|nr:Oxidation resistance protein 1 [Glycine max]